MQQSRLIVASAWLGTLLSLTQCAPSATTVEGGSGGTTSSSSGGSTASGGSTGSGGAASGGSGTSSGGATASGGKTGTASGGTTGSGGAASGGSGTSTGGTTSSGSGGSGTSTGGTTGSGSGGSGTSTGGATGSGSGGSGSGSGGSGSGGSTADPNGVPLAKPGDQATDTEKYLNLGDMRLINNRWGSDARNCSGTKQRVFVNADSTFGWEFMRPACGGDKGNPDFPEVEFGVAPFGKTSSLLTTPAFSSTALLPIQLKDLKSATVQIDNFAMNFSNPTYWDSNFEFWISKMDPTANDNAGVYAEIIAFTGWQANRLQDKVGWPCDKSGSVTAGSTGYNLCHQSDSWSNGQWRFFNFNVNNGPLNTFNGKVDIKAMLDWVRSKYSGFTDDMWLTRIEVGTEVDDNTSGSAKINNLTFEINGTSKSAQIAK